MYILFLFIFLGEKYPGYPLPDVAAGITSKNQVSKININQIYFIIFFYTYNELEKGLFFIDFSKLSKKYKTNLPLSITNLPNFLSSFDLKDKEIMVIYLQSFSPCI